MKRQHNRHTGDDQLINGMPKHMVGVSKGKSLEKQFDPIPGDPPYNPPQGKSEKISFWTVHPKAKVCDTCKAMEGIHFMEEPERPHPNCKCEIRKHEYLPQKRYLSGFIDGYNGNVVKQFFGLGLVKVTIKHVTGALGSGIHVYSNLDGVRQSHTLGKEVVFTFSTLTDTPVLWNIHIVQKGADNTMVRFEIEYEQ